MGSLPFSLVNQSQKKVHEIAESWLRHSIKYHIIISPTPYDVMVSRAQQTRWRD